MFPKSMFEATRNNGMILVHCAIVLTLVAVSIWNAILIIGKFVNDNQLTIVRTETGTDSNMFLENLTVIADYRDSLIPRTWLRELNIQNDDETTAYYERVCNAMKRRELVLNKVNLSTIDGMITAASIFSELWYLDWKFFECLDDAQTDCSFDESIQNYSHILKNGTELEALEEEFFRRMVKELVVANDGFTIHAIRNLSMLYAEVNPEKAHKQSYEFSIRLIEDSPTYQYDNDTSLSADIIIYEKRSFIKRLQYRPGSQYTTVITVRNTGIYDKSGTTPCTEDPEMFSTSATSLNHNNRDYLKAIVSKCGCVPFTDKKHFRKFKESHNTVWLPFCDYQKYFDCVSKYAPIRTDNYLPSCRVVRNEYSVSRTSELCLVDMCPYVNFEIVSSDHSYVLYQDRFQLSPTQFISQVGGEIGLYTGLSLLSVWHLIVFVYGRHKVYEDREVRKNRKGTKGLKYYKEFLLDLFKEVQDNVVQFGETEKSDLKTEKPSMEISQISGKEIVLNQYTCWDPLEKRMESMSSHIGRVEARVAGIEMRLDEIVTLIRHRRE